MLSRPSITLLALSMSLLALGCGRARGGGGGGVDGGGGGASGPLVKGLEVDGLALYQGVRMDILDGGSEVFDDAPVDVIAERPGMLRVFVDPGSSWETRTVAAVVELDVDGDTETFDAEQNIGSSGSSDNSLNSTINVEIPGEYITEDTNLVSVKLLEVEDDVDASGNDSGAEWTGDVDLRARYTGESVRIIIVPIEYRGDGSGRLPDTSESQMQLYRDGLMAQYPTREIDLVLADPMVVNYTISPFGQGWGETLNEIYYTREGENAAFEEYYYGLFNPASSFANFCSSGCIAGLSSLAQSPQDSWARVSMGLGFSGQGSVDTMVHEIGHAHGREHAPCGVQDAGYYPHSGASIGVQGYDFVNRELKSTSAFTDFMGYCDPTWVSDYTYDWLQDRITAVNGANELHVPDDFSPRWASAMIGMDGAATRGTDMTLRAPPQGKATDVAFYDAQGELLDVVGGSFHPYSHIPGGTLLFPEPPAKAVAAQIVGEQDLIDL